MSLPDRPNEGASTGTGAYPLSANSLDSLVRYTPSAAGTSLVSAVDLPAGALLTRITTSSPAPAKRWSTVQTGRDSHMELNSALLYMNHSCAPAVELDVARGEVRVSRKGQGIKEGDPVTFFYPSTEWDFAAPFSCLCGSEGCVGEVRGAKFIAREEMGRWWFNEHIVELARERDGR